MTLDLFFDSSSSSSSSAAGSGAMSRAENDQSGLPSMVVNSLSTLTRIAVRSSVLPN